MSNIPGNYAGVVLSEPGTEKVVLSASEIDFMICMAAGEVNKQRYCIVRKTQSPRFAKEPVDSNGYPVSIVTRIVFDAMVNLVNNAGKQLRMKLQEIDMLTVKCDSYKMTIDSLRKNGVID